MGSCRVKAPAGNRKRKNIYLIFFSLFHFGRGERRGFSDRQVKYGKPPKYVYLPQLIFIEFKIRWERVPDLSLGLVRLGKDQESPVFLRNGLVWGPAGLEPPAGNRKRKKYFGEGGVRGFHLQPSKIRKTIKICFPLYLINDAQSVLIRCFHESEKNGKIVKHFHSNFSWK